MFKSIALVFAALTISVSAVAAEPSKPKGSECKAGAPGAATAKSIRIDANGTMHVISRTVCASK